MNKNYSWFSEPACLSFEHRYKVEKVLFKGNSKFQKIEIIENLEFGKMLILDGAVQTSEKDEFIYHEMLVHVPLFTHPHPKSVLIVGGGDGGALRRTLYHPVDSVSLVELDQEVVEVCQKFLPSVSGNAFKDKRSKIIFGDGVNFIKKPEEKFDVILVDSTDPIGPAEKLFSKEFYRDAFNALKDKGIFVTQSGSPIFQENVLKLAYFGLKSFFPLVHVYLCFVPTYPGVLWSYTIASKFWNPVNLKQEAIEKTMNKLNLKTNYYSPQIHLSAFSLPKFIQDMIRG